MDSTLRARLHDLTLGARRLLTEETAQLLEGVYGLHADGRFEPSEKLPAVQHVPEAAETRARLERLLADEKLAGLGPREAVAKLTKEVAYTWLNRVAAFKMLEARKLIRQSVSRGTQSNGFLRWLGEPGHEDDYARYEAGSLPTDALGEGPRDTAYRHYLLHICGDMAAQIRVLFDADTLPSRLFPRPRALAGLLVLMNVDEVGAAWADDETIGWIYQYFNETEKTEVFARLSKGAKIATSEIPAATQLFTPRWIVRALVENSLGRLWLQMHPDSRLRNLLSYLVPDVDAPPIVAKPVSDITFLDPACGTMHFGLVAFELFAEMYAEELERAGEAGWPMHASVHDASAIAAAIIENNMFGIDIDQRAVQLAAVTLYVKAAALNPHVTIRTSNLTSADILPLSESHVADFIESSGLTRPIYSRLISELSRQLKGANELGSLLRLDTELARLVATERAKFEQEQVRPHLPGFAPTQFESEAGRGEFWDIITEQILQAFDEFAKRRAAEGIDERYFTGEATKGLRILRVLMHRYDVVAANPPYMSSRNMSAAMNAYLKDKYPASKGDLYAAFIDRCSTLLAAHGRLAMIAQQSYMFISSYEDLRARLRTLTAVETMIHVGARAFAEIGGEKVNTTLFVLRAEPDAACRDATHGVYLRLVREPDAEAKRLGFERAVARLQAGETDGAVYRYRQGDFDAIPGAPWVYWITPGLRRLFQSLPKLGDVAPGIHGTTTYDNYRFLRFWWEVGACEICRDAGSWSEFLATSKSFVPYMKGGDFCRWWGNQEYVLHLAAHATEFTEWLDLNRDKIRGQRQIFRRGVTWTDLTSGRFAARLSPGGFIFDVKGSSAFPQDTSLVLGLLNSSFAHYALSLLNPTVSFQVGDLARLPVPTRASETLHARVDHAIALARADSAEDETTYEFVAPPAWPHGVQQVAARHAALAAVEREIDEEVYRLYGISAADRAAIEAELANPVQVVVAGEVVEASDAAGGSTDGEGDAGDEPQTPDGALLGLSAPDAVYAAAALGGGAGREALARRWVSYAVGVVLGRFAPGVEGAIGNGMAALPAPGETPAPEMLAIEPMDGELASALRTLVVPNGIAVLDAGHPDDLAARVTRALGLLVGEGAVEGLLAAATGGKTLSEWLATDFFKEHVKLYRKRPIYWLLQSPLKSAKRRYSVYVWSERVTRDTLHLLRGQHYVAGRAARLRDDATRLSERIAGQPQGSDRRRAERELDAQEAELADLEAFDKALAAVTLQQNSRGETVGWAPELDDGVLLNLAPLAPLLPGWPAEAKAVWAELERGAYDWSHTAMRYWPDRVLAKCKENKSYAIAHDVE